MRNLSFPISKNKPSGSGTHAQNFMLIFQSLAKESQGLYTLAYREIGNLSNIVKLFVHGP